VELSLPVPVTLDTVTEQSASDLDLDVELFCLAAYGCSRTGLLADDCAGIIYSRSDKWNKNDDSDGRLMRRCALFCRLATADADESVLATGEL